MGERGPRHEPARDGGQGGAAAGENGELVYNTRKAYRIALAAFEHGAYYYTVDSQLLSAAKILALAEMVHKKVAG